MGEIEVNEHVRTKDGIIDKVIIEYNGKCNNSNCSEKHISCKYNYYNEKDIVNHSKQLIDLIKVKDLVCFKNKLQNSLENEEMIIHIFDNDTLEEVKQAIEKGEIKLLEILTHEQFEQSSYKVGGEKDETSND